jgi:hypothetical protein
MSPIEIRLKDVLDETRLTMLGAQLLVGLQYRAAFTPGFGRLPASLKWCDGAALLLILCSTCLLLSTPTFHQIAERGHATGRMLIRGSSYLKWALAPLSVALAIDVALAFYVVGGQAWAKSAGISFVVGTVFAWFVFPFYGRRSKGESDTMEDKKQSLEARIAQALTEIRVILPGAQALFGFQVTAVLTAEFGGLPDASRYVHLASITAVAMAIVMLIAPAAYHRIAARGGAEQDVLDYAVRMMLPAEGLIALGLIGGAYVTFRMISASPAIAACVAAVGFFGFAGLLYVVPLMARRGPAV